FGQRGQRLIEDRSQVGSFQPATGFIAAEQMCLDGIADRAGVKTQRFAPPALPPEVESGIGNDTKQPRLEGTASLKTRQVSQRLDKPFLDRVESIGFIAEQAIGHAKRRLTIAPE